MWPGGYVKHAQDTRSELQVGGVLYHDNCARFSLVASGDGMLSVQRAFVRLHGYAECDLRDEVSTVAAFMGVSAYHIHISSDYSEYDLIPLRPYGKFGFWQYKGDDFDEFFLDFECKPYTLYIISIEVEARDLKQNKDLTLSSELYRLIRVVRGNRGGCLDVKGWYKPEMLRLPIQVRYSSGIPTPQYQLLTVNLRRDEAYLEEVGVERLRPMLPKLYEIVRTHKDNTVFTNNLRLIKEFISQRSASTDFWKASGLRRMLGSIHSRRK